MRGGAHTPHGKRYEINSQFLLRTVNGLTPVKQHPGLPP
jgi:hypothetical protein